jgi:hypothetical protein
MTPRLERIVELARQRLRPNDLPGAATLSIAVIMMAAPLTTATAQSRLGAIAGVARVEGLEAPMAFTLVRLTQASGEGGTTRQGLTNGDGHFRFDSLADGDYRIHVLRIGYQPAVSPVLHVRNGNAVQYELASQPIVVELSAMIVRPTDECLEEAGLDRAPDLRTVWNEARKGIETRRAFELRYRFTRSLRQDAQIRFRLRRDRRQTRSDIVVSEPDSVVAREQRARALHDSAGYGIGNRLIIPDEKEMLDARFLATHCLESGLARESGAYGVKFRPVRTERGQYAIRGTIWLDSATYLVKRIEYVHLSGDEEFSDVRIDYADVHVGQQSLRLPSSGRATLRLRGPVNLLASGVVATLTYTYWDFTDVASPH